LVNYPVGRTPSPPRYAGAALSSTSIAIVVAALARMPPAVALADSGSCNARGFACMKARRSTSSVCWPALQIVGSSLTDSGVVDQDLAVVLLDLPRRPIDEYGETPAAMMLIDRAVSAYQNFIRVEGWVGNLAIHIEHEFFGLDGPGADFRARYGREGHAIRGLSVEVHVAHLREGLIPLTERCGRVMHEALSALEILCAAPSQAVERSKPIKVSIIFGHR
jgi:hypothetical protein